MNKKVNIIETTLRDGSYAVNFSFTSTDTSQICASLENVGFEYIEIGHGVGLNAANSGFPVAVQTDEEYMIAANKALKKAKYGMFCIPGIARLKDIDLGARHNMGFIRIGANATDIEKTETFIKRAKKHKMFVCANFMKSYALEPKNFAEKVKLSENFGVDMVYIVDSAGGMFPEDLDRYYEAIRKVSRIPLGFHGHDNLSLAVCNNLKAVKLGMEFIDSSLQGLGRSGGNAATEILVAVLLKLGYAINIDFIKLLEIGQKYINPLISAKGKQLLDIVAGYADFHSSYMHHIHKYAALYRINPAVLIIELTKIDKVDVDERVLNKVARKVKRLEEVYLGKFDFTRYVGHEQEKIK